MTSTKTSRDIDLWPIGALVISILILLGVAAGRHTGVNDARRACVEICECPHKEVAP